MPVVLHRQSRRLRARPFHHVALGKPGPCGCVALVNRRSVDEQPEERIVLARRPQKIVGGSTRCYSYFSCFLSSTQVWPCASRSTSMSAICSSDAASASWCL